MKPETVNQGAEKRPNCFVPYKFVRSNRQNRDISWAASQGNGKRVGRRHARKQWSASQDNGKRVGRQHARKCK